ncbi:MAG TPA: hypothetical protein VFO60_07445 [Candidatus Dormibacteraeota bacterium]|nr:hypothetical protein [Candidatus Dormibacteraeota bacterium]
MTHVRLPALAEKGFLVLRDRQGPPIPEDQFRSLEFMDWKSGGDTNFAPLASALGAMECAGFWDHGKADKDGIWTKNRDVAPALVDYVEAIGARYGRVRVIKLNRYADEASAYRQLHQDDNNRLNPDGDGWVVRTWLELTDTPGTFFILREDRDDPSTETRIPLHAGMQIVIDTERLWHVVCHQDPRPRHALITSVESGPALQAWIDRERAPAEAAIG